MRCSSFSLALDEYVDGTLTPVQNARIEAHVAACPDCAALLAELRVIDALLIAPRTLDPAPNFTFKVMAEVRCLPPPHRHHHVPLAAIGTYIVFGWIAIGAFFFFGGQTARAAFASVGAAIAANVRGFGSLSTAVGHVFGPHTLGVTAAMGLLLGCDLLAAALVVTVFGYGRARKLAAQRSIEPC